ncbi:phage head-tail connector protein [Cohnella suwonensis]|uniref:Phage head-tail connector protein n=1 Tax=Cohnella suwonensis TaxID=696072 RepID=A0ABW0LT12_9BACL
MSQLEKLKVMLGIALSDTSQDADLQLLLDDASADLMSWTNRSAPPVGLEPTQRQIAVIRYNKQGAEGETAHSEGGISRSFEDLPPSIQATIGQFRLLKVASYATP